MIPRDGRKSDPMWTVWDQVQKNGLIAYENDPDKNLGIGEREDFSAFGEFCNFSGIVLDVGCGPQPWPSHFNEATEGTRFVGVDPLAEDCAEYTRFKALAEYLPFRDFSFDHVAFTTSLDHFVDPMLALKEARRVCKLEGEIDIWIGVKDEATPRPRVSPYWFQQLEKPEGAEDLFHIKRLDEQQLLTMLSQAGICIVRREVIQIDSYRRNVFVKGRS
ncbi:MAG: methyltransferase domain-containing protein [Pseudomonadota bacterium]